MQYNTTGGILPVKVEMKGAQKAAVKMKVEMKGAQKELHNIEYGHSEVGKGISRVPHQ